MALSVASLKTTYGGTPASRASDILKLFQSLYIRIHNLSSSSWSGTGKKARVQ